MALSLESQAAQRDLGSGPGAEACWDSLRGVLAFQWLGNPLCPLAGEGRPAPASSRRGSGRTLGALAPRPASRADPPCDLLESHFLPRPLSRHENLEEAVWGPSVGSWVQGRDANRKRQALDSGGPRPCASRPSRAQRATHALSDARGDLRDVTGACDVAPNVPRGRIYTDRHDQRSALTRRGLAGVAPETRSGRALGWGTARPCPST